MPSREPIDYMQRTKDQYASLGYPPYQWVQDESQPPFEALNKPLSECKLGLAGSGGIYHTGQIAFHYKDDFSFREISIDTPRSELRATHFAYDLTDARADHNVVFPIDTLKTCVEEGLVGSISTTAYAFMGGIYSTRKVKKVLAPAIADRFVKDEVDVVLLVPV